MTHAQDAGRKLLSTRTGVGLDIVVDTPASQFRRIFFDAGCESFFERAPQQVLLSAVGKRLAKATCDQIRSVVQFSHVAGSLERCSRSVDIKRSRVPVSEVNEFEKELLHIEKLAIQNATTPRSRQCLREFRLPDPEVDPELYRVYGTLLDKRLIVLWGCESQAGSSIPPLEAVRKLRNCVEPRWKTRLDRLLRIGFWLLLLLLCILLWMFFFDRNLTTSTTPDTDLRFPLGIGRTDRDTQLPYGDDTTERPDSKNSERDDQSHGSASTGSNIARSEPHGPATNDSSSQPNIRNASPNGPLNRSVGTSGSSPGSKTGTQTSSESESRLGATFTTDASSPTIPAESTGPSPAVQRKSASGTAQEDRRDPIGSRNGSASRSDSTLSQLRLASKTRTDGGIDLTLSRSDGKPIRGAVKWIVDGEVIKEHAKTVTVNLRPGTHMITADVDDLSIRVQVQTDP